MAGGAFRYFSNRAWKSALLLMFQLLPSQVTMLLPGSKKGTSLPRKLEPAGVGIRLSALVGRASAVLIASRRWLRGEAQAGGLRVEEGSGPAAEAHSETPRNRLRGQERQLR